MPDPADPQSFNRYSYGLNNPLKFRDPSGHAVGAGGAFGGVLEPEWPHSAVPLVAVQPANGFTLINAGENLYVTTQAARGGTRLVGGMRYTSQIVVYGTRGANEAVGINPFLRHARASHPQLSRFTSPSAAFRTELLSKASGLTALFTVAGNAVDHLWGANSEHGIVSTEFAAANTVDLATGVGAPAAAAAVGIGCGPAAPICVPGFAGATAVVDILYKVFIPEARQGLVDTVDRAYEWYLSPEVSRINAEMWQWQAAGGMY